MNCRTVDLNYQELPLTWENLEKIFNELKYVDSDSDGRLKTYIKHYKSLNPKESNNVDTWDMSVHSMRIVSNYGCSTVTFEDNSSYHPMSESFSIGSRVEISLPSMRPVLLPKEEEYTTVVFGYSLGNGAICEGLIPICDPGGNSGGVFIHKPYDEVVTILESKEFQEELRAGLEKYWNEDGEYFEFRAGSIERFIDDCFPTLAEMAIPSDKDGLLELDWIKFPDNGLNRVEGDSDYEYCVERNTDRLRTKDLLYPDFN